MVTPITLDILSAHLICRFKAHLRFNGQQGTKSDYETALLDSRNDLKLNVLHKIVAKESEHALTTNVALTRHVLSQGVPLIIDADLSDERLHVHFDGLKRVNGASDLGDFHYLPIMFYEGRTIRKPQRILLEALGLLLAGVQGRRPNAGIIYHGSKCAPTTVRFVSGMDAANELLEEVTRLQQGAAIPKLFLNDHCQVCEFRQRCHAQAVSEDNLSLLRGLGEKEIKSLGRKGLFTLTQLAHTFRPRRKGKRSEERSNHRYHALQALAIRDKTVYVLGAPHIPSAAVRIYMDVEGNPEKGFVYLIGMIVCDGDGERHYSLWADNIEQEEYIFQQFLAVVSRYDNPQVFCYGSYEKAFIKRMRRSAKRKKLVDKVIDSLFNALSMVYVHFYFPVYSNGLKSVAGCMGHSWSDENASGVQSIAWRIWWEQSGDDTWKQKLVQYNQEDCAALRKVTNFLTDAATFGAVTPVPQLSAQPNSNNASGPQVVRVLELDRLANGHKWGRVNFVHSNFEFVNNCAYFDYQRQRVFVRTSRTIRKHRGKTGQHRNRKIRPSRRVLITASKCPNCGGIKLAKLEKGVRPDVARPRLKRVLDLVITASGMRRKVIECRSVAYHCTSCGHAFVPDRHRRLAKHFHGLMSWTIYEHVAHQVSSGALEVKFREFFGLAVADTEHHMFKGLMARYYRDTYRRLLANILTGPVLHVDETEVKLRTDKGYVWVFTSLEDVVFMYKPTRQGEFLREMLKEFRGVLVSDFYAAYDSIECDQQKCLIHLIRDMNQELLNNPFDEDLRLVTLPFSNLLKSVVATVDEHGLKLRHLRRHQGEVDKFFHDLAAQRLSSDAAVALRVRLEKNREKLFEFIRHNGVPWNNNNAENAIKRFAYYRENTVGTMREAGLTDYLILLSLYQTCRYKGVSFLKFLLSRQRDIDAFCAKKRPLRHTNIELYPKGFVSPLFKKSRAARASKYPPGIPAIHEGIDS